MRQKKLGWDKSNSWVKKNRLETLETSPRRERPRPIAESKLSQTRVKLSQKNFDSWVKSWSKWVKFGRNESKFLQSGEAGHVLKMFLQFWPISASRSYKLGSYKKKTCIHDFDSIIAVSITNNTYCSWKIKNKIRTFEPKNRYKFKNTQAELKISCSYKINVYFTFLLIIVIVDKFWY